MRMTTYDVVLHKLDTLYERELEVKQRIIEQMVQENMKEWEYLDICLKYHREPVLDLYQEGLIKKIKTGANNAKLSGNSLITRFRALMRRNTVVMKTLLKHGTDVMGGFSGKFRKSGAKKSTSAIAMENLRKQLDPDKKLAQSVASVKVPYTGDLEQEKIELINSTLLIKEFHDDDSFEVDLMGVNYLKNEKGKSLAIADKGEGVKTFESLLLYTNSMLYFVKHQDDLEEMCDLIVEGFKQATNEGTMEPSEYVKKVSKLKGKTSMKTRGLTTKTSTRLSMRDVTEFQSKINKLAEQLDFAQNGNNALKDVDLSVIGALNDLMGIMETIQWGFTSLTNAMQKVFLIDLKFMNSITDRDVLSKFVYECIKNGIPPKFIAYNTWLIANESIRGSASIYKPVGGQTRCVFFPNDNKKEILKIAINGLGITSNKNEIRFTEFLHRYKEQDMIDISALVTNSYAEDAILAMERIVDRVGKHPDLIVLNEVKTKYQQFVKRHPELRLVVSDFNDGNVMWSSDKNMWVCIDYGLGKRNNKSQEKIDKSAEKHRAEYDKMLKEKALDVKED